MSLTQLLGTPVGTVPLEPHSLRTTMNNETLSGLRHYLLPFGYLTECLYRVRVHTRKHRVSELTEDERGTHFQLGLITQSW